MPEQLNDKENMFGIYRHFKGGLYMVSSEGIHTETNERFVVYRNLLHEIRQDYFLRPYDNFNQLVEVDGQYVPRFKKLTDEEAAKEVKKHITSYYTFDETCEACE
jgi:hypothetical protein